jgi:transcriptional antiterminator NusG
LSSFGSENDEGRENASAQENERASAANAFDRMFGEDDAPGDGEAGAERKDAPEPTADEVLGGIKGEPAQAPEPAPAPPTPAPESAGESPQSGAAADSEDEEPAEEEVPPAEQIVFRDDGVKRRWYALHAYSGQEGNVKKNLLVKAEQEGLEDLFGPILVPMEEVAEIKAGEKKISKRKFFPGYVLVHLPEHPERDPKLWHLIKETPGVSSFIGSKTVPVPLDDAEVNAIIEEVRGERERPKPKVEFEAGDRVKIIDGPFANFLGNVDEINAERGTMKVMVEIFERLTSVEVEFWQVEKI